jgi:predicted nucleotidyltransferase
MGRIEAIAMLQGHARTLKAMGAMSLYVFGSTVRDDGRPARDLDLFIDYDLDNVVVDELPRLKAAIVAIGKLSKN